MQCGAEVGRWLSIKGTERNSVGIPHTHLFLVSGDGVVVRLQASDIVIFTGMLESGRGSFVTSFG